MAGIVKFIGLGTCLICVSAFGSRLIWSPPQDEALRSRLGTTAAEESVPSDSLPRQPIGEPPDETNPFVMTAFAELDTDVDGAPVSETHSAEHRTAVEAAIVNRFPGLSNDVVAGWVDGYADLSLDELGLLLEQKQRLPEFVPGGRCFSNLPTASEPPPVIAQNGIFETARMTVRNNLLHLDTPGHRRQQLLTTLDGLDARVEPSSIRLSAPSFDFSSGRTITSGSPLHLAIIDNPQAMFRLEPGCVLTRRGNFERLEDGRLGLRYGSETLALYGDIQIPSAARQLRIETNGLVTCRSDAADNEARRRTEIGRIQVAVIEDMSLLQSHNGVFFTLPAEEMEHQVIMTAAVPLKLNAVELSNTKSDAELKALERLEKLQR